MRKMWSKLFLFSASHRKLLWSIVFAISCLAVWSAATTGYSTDMRRLLPADSKSAEDLNAVLNSGMTNRMTIYFSRIDGKALDNEADMKTMRLFAEKLEKTDGIDLVICSPVSSSQEQIYRDFVKYFPLMHSPSQLPEKEKLDRCFKTGLKSLYLNPLGGSLQCKYDLFGWTSGQLMKFENILNVSGLQFYSGNSSFIFSPDRKYCLMPVFTEISASDYHNSIKLIKDLQQLSGKLPGHFKCEIFSPHMHMLENAEIMKTDLLIFSICTLILFSALFAFIYRFDWRGLIIPMLAALGSLWAAGVMGLIFDKVFLFTLAMGGVLIGIAGDYGIHLYAAALSIDKRHNGIDLMPKLLLAFLTTATAFSGFIFSGVPAFVQFGTYSILTLLFAFLLLLIMMPGLLFFGSRKDNALNFFTVFKLQKISLKHAWLPLLVLIVFISGLFKTSFDMDIRKFDIAYSSSIAKESVYQKAFTQSSHPFILLYFSDTYDDLLEKCRKDKESLQSAFSKIKIISPSDIFMPEAAQKQNLKEWRKFISSGDWEKYKKKFIEKALRYDFTEEFFSHFFSEIEKSVTSPPQKQPELLAFTHRNMLSKTSHWCGVAMVDRKSISKEELQKNTSALIFSEDIFTEQLFKDITGALPKVLPLVLFIVFMTVIINLRSFTKTCLAFLPVIAGVTGIFGIHGLLNQNITLAVLVAGIITVGIAIDYGLLLVKSTDECHIFNSIAFSTVTTAAGGMTVFFTHHPMLRAAGLTIVTGILSSCFFSFCLLYPLLKKIITAKAAKMNIILVITALCICGCGCTNLSRETVLPLLPTAEGAVFRYPQPENIEFQGSLLLDYKVKQHVFLIAGKIQADGRGDFYGFSPGGVRLFSLSGKGIDLKDFRWMKFTVPDSRQKSLSAFMYKAIACGLYIPADPLRITSSLTSEKSSVLTGEYSDGSRISYFYTGAEGIIAKKEYRRNDFRGLVEFCHKQPGSDSVYLYSDSGIFKACLKMNFH